MKLFSYSICLIIPGVFQPYQSGAPVGLLRGAPMRHPALQSGARAVALLWVAARRMERECYWHF